MTTTETPETGGRVFGPPVLCPPVAAAQAQPATDAPAAEAVPLRRGVMRSALSAGCAHWQPIARPDKAADNDEP